MIFRSTSFQKALPVWECGKSQEMNHMLLFTSDCPAQKNVLLRVSGYTSYQIFVNDILVSIGPARAGKGYYRVDELLLDPYLKNGQSNCITVLCTGYYCRNYYIRREPSFFCAEIVCDGQILSYTGGNGWTAYACPEHVQKVPRYSYQRTFAEIYDYRRTDARPNSIQHRTVVPLEICQPKQWITREVALPDLETEPLQTVKEIGQSQYQPQEKLYTRRFITLEKDQDGFDLKDWELPANFFAEQPQQTPEQSEPAVSLPLTIETDHYAMLSLAGNRSGLIELEVEACQDTDLWLTFDEILLDGKVDPMRYECLNFVVYRLRAGERYHLLTVEPYTFRYINISSMGGSVILHSFALRRVEFNQRAIRRTLNVQKADPVITRIYHAALETFMQNTFDIYMDCPSRERAGWLCDSFFTSRVEYLLTGKTTVEHAFLANFAMVERFEKLPDGMLPRCYPSDVLYGEFIPNWAMWFVLELEEYEKRSGDTEMIGTLRAKMYALLNYFRRFENADGLLQNLEGWIFVEWSRSNDLVQNVNYPTNMLYYRFKKVLAHLYNDSSLNADADQLRQTIRSSCRNGLFFCDHSVQDENGKLHLDLESTETCQYYAFFTGVASIEEDAQLWDTMVNDFGPERKIDNRHPDIAFSNAFIGNYLRLDLLARAGLHEKLEENIRGYFDFMAQLTDTLWENDNPSNSCNHGFASHVLVWLEQLGYLNPLS